MSLNKEQLEKLSDLFMDLAKGLFLGVLTVPVFSSQASVLTTLKGITAGFIFVYLSLKAIKLKEEI